MHSDDPAACSARWLMQSSCDSDWWSPPVVKDHRTPTHSPCTLVDRLSLSPRHFFRDIEEYLTCHDSHVISILVDIRCV